MGDLGSIPGLGRSPEEGKGYPLQYSGLESSMDCINSQWVTKSWTRLSDFHFSSQIRSVQFISSVVSDSLRPMNHSMPGLPVHHQLPEYTQTHVHRVSDAIQPSHPGSSPLLLPPIPPSIKVFSNESTLCMRWPKYWSFSFSIIPSKEIPGLISFRTD